MFEGGCGCNAVRFRVTSKPIFVHCCHCRECQRISGTAFALNAIIEADRVELLSGELISAVVPTPSGAGQNIFRCATCMTAVWSNYGSVGDAIHFVRVGALDNPEKVPADIHIYIESKQPWVQIPKDIVTALQYYDRETIWPERSLARRRAALGLEDATS